MCCLSCCNFRKAKWVETLAFHFKAPSWCSQLETTTITNNTWAASKRECSLHHTNRNKSLQSLFSANGWNQQNPLLHLPLDSSPLNLLKWSCFRCSAIWFVYKTQALNKSVIFHHHNYTLPNTSLFSAIIIFFTNWSLHRCLTASEIDLAFAVIQISLIGQMLIAESHFSEHINHSLALAFKGPISKALRHLELQSARLRLEPDLAAICMDS